MKYCVYELKDGKIIDKFYFTSLIALYNFIDNSGKTLSNCYGV